MTDANKPKNFSPAEVRRAAEKGELHAWVYNFLSTIGKNKAMAHGILRRKSEDKLFWVGPILFPLTELIRCCGPERGMEYRESKTLFEKRVAGMIKNIRRGWIAPLLIANPRPWPALSVRDGNHRYEALVRLGKKKYWTLFWFESEKERLKFIRKYKVRY